MHILISMESWLLIMALWKPKKFRNVIPTFFLRCIDSLSVNPSILGWGRAQCLTFELHFISLCSPEVRWLYYPARGLLYLKLTHELTQSELFYPRPVWCPSPPTLQFAGLALGKWIFPHWPGSLPWSGGHHSQWRTGHLKCNIAEAKNTTQWTPVH